MLTFAAAAAVLAVLAAAARSDHRRTSGRNAALDALAAGADPTPHTRVECHKLAGCAVLDVAHDHDGAVLTVLPAVTEQPGGHVSFGGELELTTLRVRGRRSGRVAMLAKEALVYGTRIDLAVEKAYLADGSLGVVAVTATSHGDTRRYAAAVDAFPDPAVAGFA